MDLRDDPIDPHPGELTGTALAPFPASRAAFAHDTLLGLLQSERRLQKAMGYQRRVLDALAEAAARLFLSWRTSREPDVVAYHSLHELLTLDEGGDERETGAGVARVRGRIAERLLDARGLPPAHALLCGSLTARSRRLLLPHLQRWVRVVGDHLPASTAHHRGEPAEGDETEAKAEEAGDRRAPPTLLSPNTAFTLVASALDRLFGFLQAILEGAAASVWQDARLRPHLRFILADVEEARDVLMEEAVYRRQQHGLRGEGPWGSWARQRPASPPPFRELLHLLQEAGARDDSPVQAKPDVGAEPPSRMPIADVVRIAKKADNACVLLKACIETR